jgi:hypothetical protein
VTGGFLELSSPSGLLSGGELRDAFCSVETALMVALFGEQLPFEVETVHRSVGSRRDADLGDVFGWLWEKWKSGEHWARLEASGVLRRM